MAQAKGILAEIASVMNNALSLEEKKTAKLFKNGKKRK